MAVFSQIEKLDWTGKKVFPVMTHEGSGLGSSVRDLRNACKGASVDSGLAIEGSSAAGSSAKVSKWAKGCVE